MDTNQIFLTVSSASRHVLLDIEKEFGQDAAQTVARYAYDTLQSCYAQDFLRASIILGFHCK